MPEDVSRRSPPLLTRNFIRLLVAQACFGYAFSSFFMLPKFLVTQLDAGPVEIGWVASAYGAAVILFMPAMGVLVDRFGRRRFFTAGALLMAVASAAFVTASEVGLAIYLLRATQGLAFAMVFVGGSTIAVNEAPAERIGQALALFGLTMLAMNGVAAAGVEAISSTAGWPYAFAAAACTSTICALLSRGLDDGGVVVREEPAVSLWHVASRPSLVPMWLVIALVGAAMSSMVTYHQPFAIDLGIESVSGFFVAYAAGAILVRVGLGHFIDQAGRRRVAIGSLCLYVVVVASMAHLGGVMGLVAMGFGLGVAHGFFYPALNSLAIDGIRGDESGKVMALFQGAFHLGFAMAALLFGWVAESKGYPQVFNGGAACALIALVVLIASGDRRVAAQSCVERAIATRPSRGGAEPESS
jgi:MFS family permease